MAKILGIDYGRKKIGLAISDEGEKIALPFSVIKSKNPIPEIVSICKNHNIKNIILGLPKTMRGEIGQQAEEVKKFAQSLKKAINNINVILEDERLTSKMAKQFLIKEKKDDDVAAAQILLQDYLDREK